MPLAEAQDNRLSIPLKLPLWNGKKPTSLLELMQKSSGDQNPSDPLQMSAQQKSNNVDLALYRFAQAQTGNRFNPTHSTHPSYIKKASVRRAVGEYTSALIEGMCISKELSEDKLYAFMEFNFDMINLKDANQSHVDLIKVIQVHASPALTAIPGVQEAFERLERTLSKLLVPYMNAVAIRRGFSPEHQAMINPLSVDPEVADDDSGSVSDKYYVDPTLKLDVALPEQAASLASANAVAFPPTQLSASTHESDISDTLAVVDFELGSGRNAARYQEKGTGTGTTTARGKTKATSKASKDANLRPVKTVIASTAYDADGEVVLGTFVPLVRSGLSRQSVAQFSGPSHPRAMYQLVQLATSPATQVSVPIGEAHNLWSINEGECDDDYEVLSPSLLRSHSDSDSSHRGTTKFRPSRQSGQGRSQGY